MSTQLAFGVLLISLYTGSLSTFLSMTDSTAAISQFEDLYDSTSLYYSSTHTVCVPEAQVSVGRFLDTVERLQDVTFQRTTAPTIKDCLMQVRLTPRAEGSKRLGSLGPDRFTKGY